MALFTRTVPRVSREAAYLTLSAKVGSVILSAVPLMGAVRIIYAVGKGSATGGGNGGTCPPMFKIFNIMPMGAAWKEWTSNGSRPPNHRVATEPLAVGVQM